MSDELRDLQHQLAAFAHARDWERFHTPRNLAALISTEAGELLALFRWDQAALQERREKVEAELADVFLGILRFADVAGIDLLSAAQRKLHENAQAYPVETTTGPDRP
ncbi:MAG TPA: nucleotide pyrophosphohydrolase [Longimicrobium sp.]|nr:nucleotide pyrophosphohydrolase [Longimicrobium sp.]